MRIYPKEYLYTDGKDAALDADFAAAKACGKVKAGSEAIYFKAGFKWYAVPVSRIRRMFRRMDMVYGKLCCGGRTYDVQMLVIIDDQGREIEIHIGDDMKEKAEALYEQLKELYPQVTFGKPKA